jgi:hypothetical protein
MDTLPLLKSGSASIICLANYIRPACARAKQSRIKTPNAKRPCKCASTEYIRDHRQGGKRFIEPSNLKSAWCRNARRSWEAGYSNTAHDRTTDIAGSTNGAMIRRYIWFKAYKDAAVAFLSDIEVATTIVRISFRLAQIEKFLL